MRRRLTVQQLRREQLGVNVQLLDELPDAAVVHAHEDVEAAAVSRRRQLHLSRRHVARQVGGRPPAYTGAEDALGDHVERDVLRERGVRVRVGRWCGAYSRQEVGEGERVWLWVWVRRWALMKPHEAGVGPPART